MTTPVAERLLTAEEFAQTVDPPGLRSELISGRIVQMPPAKTIHGDCAGAAQTALRIFVMAHGLGRATAEGGYILSRNPDTVRAPDAAFVSTDRLPGGKLPKDDYVEGAPNLAVEVVSSSQTEAEVAAKIAMWLAAGTERVWEVRPRTRTVTVHGPGEQPTTLREGEALTSDDAGFSVEGFSLLIADLFA